MAAGYRRRVECRRCSPDNDYFEVFCWRIILATCSPEKEVVLKVDVARGMSVDEAVSATASRF